MDCTAGWTICTENVEEGIYSPAIQVVGLGFGDGREREVSAGLTPLMGFGELLDQLGGPNALPGLHSHNGDPHSSSATSIEEAMVAAMLEEETSVTSGVSGRFGDLDLREDGDVDGNRQKGRAGSEVRLGPSLSSKRRSWAVPQGPAMDEREGRAEQFGNAEDLSVPSAEKLRRRIFRLSLAAIEAHHRTISVQASRDLADGITGTPAYMAEGSALAASSLSAGILAGLAAPWKRHRNQHDEHAKEEASSLSPNEPYHVHHQYHQHSHHPHLNTSLLSQHPKAEASLSPTEPNHLCQQQQHHLPHSKTLLPDQHMEEYITSLIAAHDEELTLRRGEIFW